MVFDIIFIAALLIVCVIGYVKSFTGIVRGALFIVCLVAGTAILTQPLTRLFELTGLGRLMANSFAENFAEKGGAMSLTIEEGTKAAISAGLKDAGVPGFLASPCAALIMQMLPTPTGTIAQLLGRLLSKVILSGIAAIILFIFITILFVILKNLLLRTHENDLFRRIDGILGIVVIVVILLCVTWFLLGVVQAEGATKFGIKSVQALNKTYILRFMYLNNPLAGLAAGLFG